MGVVSGELGKLEITTAELKGIVGKMQTAAGGASTGLGEGVEAKVTPAVESYSAAVRELQMFCGVEEKR